MTSAVQIRRDTAATIAGVTPLQGELAYATDTKVLSIGDGSTAGGNALAPAGQTHAATAKTTPVDADEMQIVDSAASFAVKKITWANVKAGIFSAFGALVAAATGKTTPVDADSFAIQDSAASNATKQVTFTNAWTSYFKAKADALYQPLATALSNFVTLVGTVVSGDILYGSGAGTLARLAKGTDGNVLTLASGVPAWGAGSSSAPTMRNRLVNPAMQISSINGNTSGTSSGYFPADNWGKYHVSSAGTLTVQRVQSVTPKGAKDRIRITITVADTSIAAGEYLVLTQNMVGQEVADFQYGGASAKQALLRFLFKGPAGTYAISLGNAAQNRSYVALFTVSAGQANTDTIQTFTIPGDTTGTWATDTTTGITLNIVLCCGSTFQGTTGWQAGNIFGTSGVSNGMGTVSAVFEIGEAGFYLDVASAGVFPTWELPSFQVDYDYLAVVTPWVAYTPTFTGFGTVSGVSMWSRRVGDTLQIRGYFTTGTATATEARITLGFNGTNANVTSDATKVAAIQVAGAAVLSVALGAAIYTLVESGVGYVTFGDQNASNGGLTKQNGSTYGTGSKISLMADIPISGW